MFIWMVMKPFYKLNVVQYLGIHFYESQLNSLFKKKLSLLWNKWIRYKENKIPMKAIESHGIDFTVVWFKVILIYKTNIDYPLSVNCQNYRPLLILR